MTDEVRTCCGVRRGEPHAAGCMADAFAEMVAKDAKPAWTSAEREQCRERCAQAGDPPCYEVVDDAAPCSDCRAAALGFVDRANVPVDRMRRSIHRSHRGEGRNWVD